LIQPRYFWRTTLEFTRPYDELLRESIAYAGLNKPIILFKDNDGVLTLISGHRRLAAWKATEGRASQDIPAIVCTTLDELYDACLAEMLDKDNEHDATFVPLSMSERLQLGLILRGVQVYMRSVFRIKNAKVPGANIVMEAMHPLLGLSASDWKALRHLSSAFVLYDQRESTSHDPLLAAQLLDRLDSGELTVHQAKVAYDRRPREAFTPKRAAASREYWLNHVPKIATSLVDTSDVLWGFRVIPADVDDETLIKTVADLRLVRTQLQVLIRAAMIILNERETTHE
jgi:hypothetical protein